ncbi:hypothetical protein [Flavobacterium reichenbachii]|uniref:Uncharacterized protein n=1 Tax=Flavobacterium reichenbachii TaxID=362418 RepID=A0A085ZIB0_9FLAO|nr:hypothetical protein [Flavobacterium reichenbachii]KFF04174.1 hypothetical protein IW19_00940 [Flavobacterium reichenbachii]OXB13924.1 hypothetical protein B0A68_14355 [Flavobacterium reichenbachii]
MNKSILAILIITIAAFFILRQMVYKPFMWKKAISSEEHKLQLGSFIFSRQRGSNGSQSFKTNYFVFKVIEINGDFVRLSVIRRLSEKNKISEGNFSTTSAHYKEFKKTVQNLLVTPIIKEDLYKGEGPSFALNDYLIEKYPDLKKSRYYYEDIEKEQKNQPLPAHTLDLNLYFSLVYSKKEIIEKGKLTPWIMNNSLKNTPELADRLSENIDLILN